MTFDQKPEDQGVIYQALRERKTNKQTNQQSREDTKLPTAKGQQQ